MGRIKLRVESKAPVDTLYALAQTAYDFVDAMPNIRDIVMLEERNEPKFSKAEWILDVPLPAKYVNGKLSWVKETLWNDEEHKCDIHLSPENTGIVKRIDALWSFIPRGNGAEMNMNMDFRVQHPAVNGPVHLIFDGIMRRNLEKLMLAIKAKAESAL